MPDTQISDALRKALVDGKHTSRDGTVVYAPMRAVLAALEAALSGHVIVPREPTDRMICAALDDGDKRGRSQTCTDIYRAMIQAAPPVQEMEG